MAKRCPKCGQDNPDWASFCQRCGEYFQGTQTPGGAPGAVNVPQSAAPTPGAPGQAPSYGYPTPQYQAGQRPLLGATVILILGGIVAAASVLLSVYLQVTQNIAPPSSVNPVELWFTYIGLVMIPLPIIAGLLALKRSAWGVAVGCAALGLLTAIDSILYVSGVLCLVGLILLVRRRQLFIS